MVGERPARQGLPEPFPRGARRVGARALVHWAGYWLPAPRCGSESLTSRHGALHRTRATLGALLRLAQIKGKCPLHLGRTQLTRETQPSCLQAFRLQESLGSPARAVSSSP